MKTRWLLGLTFLVGGQLPLAAHVVAQDSSEPEQPTSPLAAPAIPAAATIAQGVPDPSLIPVEPGGLTSQQVASRAIQASPTLSQKRAEVEAANARIAAARRQLVPSIGLRASYSRLSPLTTSFADGALLGARNEGPVGVGACLNDPATTCVVDSAGLPVGARRTEIEFPTNNYALNANVTVPVSDLFLRFSHAVAVATGDREAAKYALEAERLKVRSDARVLYYNWLRTQGHVKIAEQAVQQTRARLGEARTAFELGSVSQADLLKIEALVANAQRALTDATTGRDLAAGQLAIVMNDQRRGEYRVGEDVQPAEVSDADLSDDAQFVDAALSRRREIKSVEAAAKSLGSAREALAATRLPRVDATGQVDYGNPNSRYFPPAPVWRTTWQVGVVASWNISDAFVTGARVDEISAKRAAVVAQGRALAQAIASEIASAQAAVKNARAMLAAANVTLAAQQEGYRVASESFALGKVTATYLVDAESDLFNARLSLLYGRIDMTTALIQLEHALGRDTEPL